MNHKISILFPLLALSCAQQFNHGMFSNHQEASTSQEQGIQVNGVASDVSAAQQAYDEELTKALQNFTNAFKNLKNVSQNVAQEDTCKLNRDPKDADEDVYKLARDPRLKSCTDVDFLLRVLHTLIPSDRFDASTCELLLEQLLSLEAFYKYTSTKAHLLQLVLRYRRDSIITKLIDKFKQVDEKECAKIINYWLCHGFTALYIAVQAGNEKNTNENVVKQLLSVPGININPVPKNGLTVQDIARLHKDRPVLRLLHSVAKS